MCAAKEIRTPTPFRALPPQSSASTNFAIAAIFKAKIRIQRLTTSHNSELVLFPQYNSESSSLTWFRLFYKQLAIMILLNDALAKG